MAPEVAKTADCSTDAFADLICGYWRSEGSTVHVRCATSGPSFEALGRPQDGVLLAEIFPAMYHPGCHRMLQITKIAKDKDSPARSEWRCGGADLRSSNFSDASAVIWQVEWSKAGGGSSVWSRPRDHSLEFTPNVYNIRTVDNCNELMHLDDMSSNADAFPWLLRADATPPVKLPNCFNQPDILLDGSRIAALLDIRQLIGANNEAQERLTHLLMDYDLDWKRRPGMMLQPGHDYLVPRAKSFLWETLTLPQDLMAVIARRISRIPAEAGMHLISWNSNDEVWVGRHRISCSMSDISTMQKRWVFQEDHPSRDIEVARLLALYHVFQNPMAPVRSGLHLAMEASVRQQCEFELFASPLNATLPNGRFASKWPHIEVKFGSAGAYPEMLSLLEEDTILCVNPPFTVGYTTDVTLRLQDMKSKFRLRIAMPIKQALFKKELYSFMPGATFLSKFFDSTGSEVEVKHSTLFWEDKRCDPDTEAKDLAEQDPTYLKAVLEEVAADLTKRLRKAETKQEEKHDANEDGLLQSASSTLSTTATSSGSPLSSPRWLSEDCSLQASCSSNEALPNPSEQLECLPKCADNSAQFACVTGQSPGLLDPAPVQQSALATHLPAPSVTLRPFEHVPAGLYLPQQSGRRRRAREQTRARCSRS